MSIVHHPLGMSTWNKLAKCSHYESASGTSASAEAGTKSHGAFASCILGTGDHDDETAQWAADTVLSMARGAPISVEQPVIILRPGSVLNEIFGTTDACWVLDNILHVADYKTFSNGEEDYFPQLAGYATGICSATMQEYDAIHLHVLHGGSKFIETKETTLDECVACGESIISAAKSKAEAPHAGGHCQYCALCGKCSASSKEVMTIKEGFLDGCNAARALHICANLTKILEGIKERAEQVIRDNGGYLEDGDIAYGVVTRAGASRCANIADLWGAVEKFIPNQEEFLKLCNLSKTKIVAALRDSGLKKKGAEEVIAPFYVSGAPVSYIGKITKKESK